MGMDMDWIRWFILTLNSKMRDGVLFWQMALQRVFGLFATVKGGFLT